MRPVLALALGLLSGCATLARLDPPAGRPYLPLAVAVPGRTPGLLAASRRALGDLGFEVDRAAGPELEATRTTGAETRDRARVTASSDLLQIDLRTELRDTDGSWLRADRVCAEYAHVRERVLAAEILRELGAPEPSRG